MPEAHAGSFRSPGPPCLSSVAQPRTSAPHHRENVLPERQGCCRTPVRRTQAMKSRLFKLWATKHCFLKNSLVMHFSRISNIKPFLLTKQVTNEVQKVHAHLQGLFSPANG